MPLYGLSFSEAFFTGDGECDMEDILVSGRVNIVNLEVIK